MHDVRSMFGLLTCLLLWVAVYAGTQTATTDPYIIVGRLKGIDRLSLDGSSKQEIIRFDYPRRIPLNLDYDFQLGYIFYYYHLVYGDRYGIRRCSLTGQNDQPILEELHRVAYKNDIWVDRRKRRLYRQTTEGTIFSEDYEGSIAGRKKLFLAPDTDNSYSFTGFAVSPSRGIICWMTSHIACGNMDGSNIVRLTTSDWTIEDSGQAHPPPRPKALVMDEEEGKIYFASGLIDKNEDIRWVDMDTHEQKTVIAGLSTRITDMQLHDDYIYFTSGGKYEVGSVMRCSKSGGGLVTLATGFEMLFGLVVVQPPRPNQPAPVDGRWGDWGPWEACSTTCGTGSRLRRRSCDNPSPAHGGSFCEGPAAQTRDCNNGPCASYEYIVFPTNRGERWYNPPLFMSRVNMDGGEMQTMMDTVVLDMAYDAAENILFCLQRTTTDYHLTQISRCKLSDVQDQVLVTLTYEAIKLAIQPGLKKIYVRGKYGELVRRFNYDGTNEESIILAGLVQRGVQDFAVSATMGRMFFTAPSTPEDIFSTDLDGGDVNVIRTGNTSAVHPFYYGRARSLHLDESGKKLYFTVRSPRWTMRYYTPIHTKNKINVIDLETGVESTVLTGLLDTRSLRLYKNRLFFSQSTDIRPKSIQSCDTSGKDLRTHVEDHTLKLDDLNFFVLKLFDAPWSDWSVWTACTETCGNGIRTRTRTCTGAQCYGQNYEIQDCNVVDCTGPRESGWDDRRSQAVCSLFIIPPPDTELVGLSSALPSPTEKAGDIPSCYDECRARYTKPDRWMNKLCAGSMRLYPNPAARLAQGKEQVHRSRAFDQCKTKWANICCCFN